MRETLRLVALHGTVTKASIATGIPRNTLQHAHEDAVRAQERGELSGFQVVALPANDEPIESILERRIANFDRTRAAKAARKLIDVNIKMDGPIGIVHMGDPHVDDDGTDLSLIQSHVEIINRTEGMFGANLGDIQNNWIGRLARLWAEQGTSASEAWALAEWLIRAVEWLYLIGGNHDAWSGQGDPLKWIMRQQSGVFEYHGTRLNLIFPNGKTVRINARHDFAGHSMWNPAHGPMKAVQGGWRDHILTCGHKHVSFYAGPLKDPATGLLSWAIRCAGYKIFDRYAEEKGLPDQNAFCAAVTIIDPRYGDDDTKLITVIPDVHEGADFLKWKRRKKAA